MTQESEAKVVAIRSRTAPSSRRLPPTPPEDGDRREGGRVFSDGPGTMRVLEPFSAVGWIVRVLDISKTGMGLMAPVPLLPGSLIQVQVQDTAILACVRHCGRPDDAEPDRPYQIGVEIQHMF